MRGGISEDCDHATAAIVGAAEKWQDAKRSCLGDESKAKAGWRVVSIAGAAAGKEPWVWVVSPPASVWRSDHNTFWQRTNREAEVQSDS